MIIQCESCSRKFIVKDQDIPSAGRNVQCGYCSAVWHQMPSLNETKKDKTKRIFIYSMGSLDFGWKKEA